MKWVHVVQSISPHLGGLPAAAVGLAAAQAAAGDEVHLVYLLDATEREAADAQYQHHHGYEKVHHHRIGNWTVPARLFRSPANTLSGIAPDWVCIHGVWDPLLVAAARWCHAQAVPWSTVPHSMLHPWHRERHAWIKSVLQRFGWERLMTGAAFLQALNDTEKAVLENLFPDQRIEIVPNGIQVPAFEGNDSPPAEPYALFLNRLGLQKGVDVLAAHFRNTPTLPPHPWIFAGPDCGCKTALQQGVEQHPFLQIQDAQYGAAKWALIRHAGCFVLPSRSEGFSIALLEALACGVPCVITPECNFPEAVAAGAAMEVPLEGGAIVAAVDAVLSDPDRRQAMSTAARTLVASTYQWPQIASRLRVLCVGSDAAG